MPPYPGKGANGNRAMKGPLPCLTVIVAVFNGAATLQQCIDSVARQTYPNKDLIIIDGGSTDGSVDLLAASQEHINYWISAPDSGIYHAWNKGLAQAKGEWICFLGADDYFWDERVLERMAQELEKLPPDIRVAYGRIMLVSPDGASLYPAGEPWEKIRGRFRQVMCLPHPGAMHRRSMFERHGVFNESFHIAGDYELLLRELKMADAIFIPGITSVAVRQGGISSIPSNFLMSLREARRAQRMHGQYFPGWIWLMAMARVHLRLLLWRALGGRRAQKTLDPGRHLKELLRFRTKR